MDHAISNNTDFCSMDMRHHAGGPQANLVLAIKYLGASVISVAFLVALHCDLFLMFFMYMFRMTKSTTNLYILSIIVADFVYLVMIPFQLLAFVYGQWNAGLVMCKLYGAAQQTPRIFSAYLMLDLCADLYLSVFVKGDMTKSRSGRFKFATGLGSLLALGLSVTIFMFTELVPYGGGGGGGGGTPPQVCSSLLDFSGGCNIVCMGFVIIAYYIPTLLSLVFMIKASKLAPANGHDSPSFQNNKIHIMAMLIAFTLCHFLYWMVSTLEASLCPPLMMIADIAVAVNAAINPILFFRHSEGMKMACPVSKGWEEDYIDAKVI